MIGGQDQRNAASVVVERRESFVVVTSLSTSLLTRCLLGGG